MRAHDDDRREIAGAEALLTRDIEQCWRNWKAFVAEKQDELAAQQADESPEADLTGTGRPTPRTARIDAATRQTFGAVLEARRQQAQAQAEQTARQQGTSAPDADQVYTALLTHIADELDGKVHPEGYALLYYKDNPKPIKFDAAAVSAGTTDADYLALGARNGPTKRQALLVLALAVALLGVLVVMWQWAFGAPPAEVVHLAGTARVGQQTTPLWTVDAAAIGGVVVPARLRGGYPPILCVDDTSVQTATPGASVILSGTQAVRRYQVQPGKVKSEADLLLADCGASPPRTRATAQLVETRTRTKLTSETLRSVTVRGPDLDPQAIPADQMEVTLELALPDAGAGTLILADGRRWSATRSEAIAGGTRLVYLVPLTQAAQGAGWELPRGGDLPALLALTLPAPTSRAALLRRVLDVQASEPTVALRDGEPELAITLTLVLKADAAPIALLADDLVAVSNGVPVTPRWDAPQLTPGKPVTVAVRVPLRDHDTLELALAAWRVRITTE